MVLKVYSVIILILQCSTNERLLQYIFKCIPKTDIDFYMKNLVYHIAMFIFVEILAPEIIVSRGFFGLLMMPLALLISSSISKPA